MENKTDSNAKKKRRTGISQPVYVLFCMFAMLFLVLPDSSGFAQNNLPYLGQTPPGLTSQRFPPDSLLATNDWMWHGSPMFTPDGLEMFWTEYSEPGPGDWDLEIFTMRVENDNWSPVRRPVFADTNYLENDPFFTAGADTLYYYSSRISSFIRKVVRTDTGWSESQPLQIPVPAGYFYGNTFSVNNNLDIYLDLTEPSTNKSHIYVTRFQNDSYQFPEMLGPEINSAYNEYCPFIEPDEDYIIFGSDRPDGFGGQIELYISFRNEDQTWTEAINMGEEINSTGAFFPIVTLDKLYLFFCTGRAGDIGYNPYWISADIIDSLQVQVGIRESRGYSGVPMLHQNRPNPFHHRTTLSFELSEAGKITLEITNQTGRMVITPVVGRHYPPGVHTVDFDASGLPAGIYFCRLTSPGSNPSVIRMAVLP